MKFDLTGYDIDNLLKLLYRKNISIFNLNRPAHNHVSFEVDDRDIKKVKRYIANFKAVTTMSKIRRLPKFVLTNLGVVLGVFFGMIFGIFASNYTWQIKIYGLNELTESEIISVLNENGIAVGKINLATGDEISEILLNNYDRIAQVSVIKHGTAIIINLSEKLVYDDSVYEPICAQYNGIVTAINIITGTTNVKVGDYVNAGDVLVLPFNLDGEGNKISVRPLAEIYGKIFVTAKVELDRYETSLTRTGKTITSYQYKIGNINLFSGKCKNSFALFETESYNEYISDLISLYRTATTYFELKLTTTEHDFSLEKADLVEKSKAMAYASLPVYSEFLSEEASCAVVGETMYAITTLTVVGLING